MSTSTATPGYVRPVNKTFLFLHPALMSCITWPFSKEQNEKRERRSTQILKNKSYSSNSKNKTGLSHSLALLLFSLKIWLGETPVENSFPLSLRRQKTGDFSVLRPPASIITGSSWTVSSWMTSTCCPCCCWFLKQTTGRF